MLTLDELRRRIEAGAVDTVVAAFPDRCGATGPPRTRRRERG